MGEARDKALATVAACLRGRRTVSLFEERPVPRKLLRAAVEAARWAPNHHVTQPWRFYLLGQETRARLIDLNGEVVAAIKGPEIGARKARQWSRIPGFMVVTCQASNDELRQLEDYAACCCAIHNFSLYLWQAGAGMKWSTGPVTRDSRLYDILGIDQDREIVIALISHGYPRKVPRQKRLPLKDIFSVLD